MARIQEYQGQTEISGPAQTREAKEADTGNIGDAIHGLGNAVTKTGDMIEERVADAEVSHLTAKMAERHADMTKALDDALAQPGAEDDPDFAQKFMARYDDGMSDIANGAKSPKAAQYMEKANALMRSQFQTNALHGQAHLAGEQAVQNMNTTVDSLSTSVMSNPSGADNAREMADLAIDHLPSNIPERAKEAIRANAYSALAMAEVQGWAKMDPKGTLDRLEKGEWNDDLSGQQKMQLEGYAERELNGKRIEQERQQRLKKELFNAQEETEKVRLLQKLYGPLGLETKDVVGNPKLDAATQEHYLGLIERDGGKNFKSDPSVVNMLMDKIHPPDGSPGWTDDTLLYPYFGKPASTDTYGPVEKPGGLSRDDFDWLRKEITGKKTQAGQDEADLKKNFLERNIRSQLVKSSLFGLPDPDGEKHYASYLATFQSTYERLKQAGKTPQQLLNPESKDYIGNVVNPDTYRRTQNQIVQSMFPKNPALASPPSGAPGSPGGAATTSATAPASALESRRPGEIEPGNIDLKNRPRYKNADGSVSTVRSFSVNLDGQEVLLPTITADGRSISEKEAVEQYKRDGKHLGKFKDAASATAYAQQLHEEQAASLPPQKKPGESTKDYLKRVGL
jgi:hypothetical protein